MAAGVADHGMDAGFKIGAVVLTAQIKTGNWEVTPDTHDYTGSGVTDKKFRGGQISRQMTIGGWCDDSLSAGARFLETIAGTTTTFERYPSGIGSGKRKQSGSCVIGKYVESYKNDDIYQWTCELQITGSVTEGTQP